MKEPCINCSTPSKDLLMHVCLNYEKPLNDYEKLKEVIQKANPEIMELKFGCEILYRYDNAFAISGIQYDDTGDEYIDISPSIEGNNMVYLDDFKILGRPIRLADVLLALHGKFHGDFYVRADGYFFRWSEFGKDNAHQVRPTYSYWNLRNDSLNAQSDETKQFLIKLLTK